MHGIHLQLACLAAFVGAASPALPAIRASFASPMDKVFLEGPPPSQTLSTWTVSMARGEQESFQLLVHADGESLNALSVENSLDGTSHLAAKLSLVGYVRTAEGDPRPWAKQEPPTHIGWWPDPLLPIRPFDIAAGQTQPVWIRIESSPGAAPGLYKGSLRIRQGNRRLATLRYLVRVYDVTLPRKQQLRNAAFMPPGNLFAHYQTAGGMESPAFFELYKRWAREAFSQHLGPTFDMLMGWNQGQVRTDITAGPLGPTSDMLLGRTPGHLVWPVLGRNGAYDFRYTDALGDLGREYGMRQFAIAIFDRETTWAQQSEAAKAELAGFIRAYSENLKARGTWEAAYVYNVDEPPENQWDTVRNNHQLVKSIAPDLKTWLCLNQPKAVRQLQSSADILDVYIRQYDSSGVEEVRKTGKQVIWAVCVWPHEHPNLFIEYPAVDARAIGWLTYRYGISGFEYWGLNQWGENTGNREWANFRSGETKTRWRRTKWPWGDGWLLYPGENGEPLASIRFENLRDGFEDSELLSLLAGQGEKPRADQLSVSVAGSIESYHTNPSDFAAAHVELLRRLHSSSARSRHRAR
ncbi:DUF4091 domain-containing protein [Paludibaculum fermentans]|uniref:DUF4091 domain-containing protein n=1 Tax=Paludibaculum fermentans TaxID=1473598 RepID=A0A7S7SN56_PALFE|nr:DUF4091 domain-containing protein [Paludibaculum fermentans]QOY90201.1 DUF4091 domain-containing protein [Paludibaculum fermentans]